MASFLLFTFQLRPLVSHLSTLDRTMSIMLTLATVIVVGLLIEQRVRPPEPEGSLVEGIKDRSLSIANAGIALGDTSHPVKIAVFTDFECPFCRRMDSAPTALELKHSGKIARSVLHYPISSHKHSRTAALAFDCATAQGRAADMHHALYADQALLGITPWTIYASKAGVADVGEFTACMMHDTISTKISAGISLGDDLSVRGTPTVIVNDWLFHSPMPSDIEKAVSAVLADKSPKP